MSDQVKSKVAATQSSPYTRRAALRLGGGAVAALVFAACGDDATAADEKADGSGPVTAFTIVADDMQWDIDRLTVPAAQEITATIENRDAGIPHNLHIKSPGGPKTELENGVVTQTLVFTIDEPGEYEFVCDAHPNMIGTIVVV